MACVCHLSVLFINVVNMAMLNKKTTTFEIFAIYYEKNYFHFIVELPTVVTKIPSISIRGLYYTSI